VLDQRRTFARWLRICPVCGSDAVRDVRVEAVELALAHCLVRCGQCETWRALFDTRRGGRRLERRLERKRGRDRRRMTRAARRAWPTGAALEIWLSGPAAERTTVAASTERAANRAAPSAGGGGARMDP